MNIDSDCFKCPISREIMKDPVLASDGMSYERVYIETWMKTKGNYSPMTRERIKKDLITNRAIKDAIEYYKRKEKEEEKDEIPIPMKRELLSKLAEDDNFIVLEKLLKEGIFGDNIEDIAEQAVIMCLWKNHPTCLEILVEYGARIERENSITFLQKINNDYNKLLRLCNVFDTGVDL